MKVFFILNRRAALRQLLKHDRSVHAEPCDTADTLSERDIAALEALVDGLDARQALRYCLDSRGFLLEMLGEYVSARKDKELEQLTSAGDRQGTAICAHSLKSMSRTVGLTRVADSAAALQQAAESPDDIRRAASRTIKLYKKAAAQIERLPGITKK